MGYTAILDIHFPYRHPIIRIPSSLSTEKQRVSRLLVRLFDADALPFLAEMNGSTGFLRDQNG